jgi:hypothetical protein
MDTPEVAVARYAARISLWALYVDDGKGQRSRRLAL